MRSLYFKNFENIQAADTMWLYHMNMLTIWHSVLWQDNDIHRINQNYVVFIVGYYLPNLVYTSCLRHTMVIHQGWILFLFTTRNKNVCISAPSLSCKALGHNCFMLVLVNLLMVASCEHDHNRCYTCICILSFGLRIFHVTITTLNDIMNIHNALFHCYQYLK